MALSGFVDLAPYPVALARVGIRGGADRQGGESDGCKGNSGGGWAAEVRDCMVISRDGWCTARVTQGSGKWGPGKRREANALLDEQDLGVVDDPLRCGNLLCTVVPAGGIPLAGGWLAKGWC